MKVVKKKVQTSSDKINKLWGCNVPPDDHSSRYCIVYLKVSKRVELKNFSSQGKNCNSKR